MKRFLVREINAPRARVIEAESFVAEESGYSVFYDEDSNLIARFINVTVEPWSEGRESSDEVASIAGDYLDFTVKDVQRALINDGERLAKDIRSLAGSVLSQVEKD